MEAVYGGGLSKFYNCHIVFPLSEIMQGSCNQETVLYWIDYSVVTEAQFFRPLSMFCKLLSCYLALIKHCGSWIHVVFLPSMKLWLKIPF